MSLVSTKFNGMTLEVIDLVDTQTKITYKKV